MEKRTLEHYQNGYNCTQAVLKATHESLNLEQSEEDLLKMSMGLGVGMYIGETCGAVTGAIMALGIKYGTDKPNDRQSLRILYKKIKNFEIEFKNKNCSLNCKELKTVHKIDCAKLIADTGKLLRKQLVQDNS